MDITGIITVALPETSGVSKFGKSWRKRSYVCVYDNTNANYVKSIVFDVLGGKIDEFNLQQGAEYDLKIDFEAKEWNGKYFQTAVCWKAIPKVRVVQQPAQVASAPAPQGWQALYPQQQPMQSAAPFPAQDSDALLF